MTLIADIVNDIMQVVSDGLRQWAIHRRPSSATSSPIGPRARRSESRTRLATDEPKKSPPQAVEQLNVAPKTGPIVFMCTDDICHGPLFVPLQNLQGVTYLHC